MKRIVFLLCSMLFYMTAKAHNIEWYVDGNLYTTSTCQAGDNVTPPTPPAKTGYTFQEWLAYTPIEYLISSVDTYVDSGFVSANATLYTEIMPFYLSSGTNFFIGYNYNPGSGAERMEMHYSQTKLILGTGTGYTTINNGLVPYEVKASVNIKYAQSKVYLTINDQAVGTYNRNNDLHPISLYVSGAHNNNGTSGRGLNGRFYSAKIYDAADELVRDFIPVLDVNNVPCMYERVEGKFYYNIGPGDFIAGPVLME